MSLWCAVTLRNRLGLLFLSFLSLVTISVAATAWMVHDQDRDALVINLAGRQRMLVQQIVSHALQIQADRNQDEHRENLRNAETAFDQTLKALKVGGEASYLPEQTVRVPATRSDTIQAELHNLQRRWSAFQSNLRVIETEAPGSADFDAAIQSLQTLSPQLIHQADEVVRLYEAESERKLSRLGWIQAGFFVCAAGLLVSGIMVIRRAIMTPLQTLKHAARQIGQGDLSSPVQVTGPPEFVELATSIDAMRAELKTLTGELEERIHQRTRELTALYDVIREISLHLDIAHVLDSVTGKARDLLNSDVAFLCLLDGAGESMMLKAYNGPQEAVCSSCVLARHSVAQQVLGREEAMICDVGGCQMVAPDYRTSHLAAPLRVGDRVIGALCVGSRRAATYSHEQVRLLTELANSTAIALENARLYEQAERVAALEERQRIAADMHDGLAQTLHYLKLKAECLAALIGQGSNEQAAHELALISDAVERAGHEVRQSIASLRAVPVLERTVQEHLATVVSEFAQTAPEIVVELVSADEQGVTVSADAMAQVLRVVREALQNARRHASATRVIVRLERRDEQYCVTIEDDGCGFDLADVNGKGHFGLSIMQARAARIGSELLIDSAPGQGTRVILTWPIQQALPA